MEKKLRLSKIFFHSEDSKECIMVKTPLLVKNPSSQIRRIEDIPENGKTLQTFQSNVGASQKLSMIHIIALKMEVNALVQMVMCSTEPSSI